MGPSEPWFVAYQRALRRRGETLVYLLVSLTDAQALAQGKTPRRVQRQANRLVTWEPKPASGKAAKHAL